MADEAKIKPFGCNDKRRRSEGEVFKPKNIVTAIPVDHLQILQLSPQTTEMIKQLGVQQDSDPKHTSKLVLE